MKHSIRRVLCIALALLLVLGAVDDLRLAGRWIAVETLHAVPLAADRGSAPTGHSAYAEEAAPEESSDQEETPSEPPVPAPADADSGNTNEGNAGTSEEDSGSTSAPSDTPSDLPTDTPTDDPTGNPTDNPSDDPTDTPSDDPTDTPSDNPTDNPSDDPTDNPTDSPSDDPTDDPTDDPVTDVDAPADEGAFASDPVNPPEDKTQLTPGYARIASGSTVRVSAPASASELATLDAGVAYIADLDEDNDAAKICFAYEGQVYVGWADADRLTLLSEEELAALSIPADAPTYSGIALPEMGARFVLQLSIADCPKLQPGEQYKLSAAYSDGMSYAIHWSSSDPAVASVADDGTLTAVATGAATITASGICAPASIQFDVSEPASIALSAGSLTIGVGETVTDALSCTVVPAELGDALSWSSSNTRYVKVNRDSGAITGVRAGSATVTVTAPGGLRASCKVTVRNAPKSIGLRAGATVLGVGDSTPLSVRFNSGAYSHGIRYAISDESVVRLADGRLYAVAPGQATITAKTFNGKTASMKITVLPAPESVSFSAEAPTLGVGQSHRLSASVNPESVSAITFSGDNPEIAEVAPDGSVTARAIGSVTVTATAYNGVSSSQTINVVAAPTRIELSASSVTLCVGEKLDAPVRIQLDSEITGGLSFKSSNTRYATVNGSGRVSALRKGSVTITIRTYNGVTAKYTVRIVKAPSKIALSGANMLGVGDSAALKVTANSGAGVGHYSLSSSDPSILEIDPATNRVLAIAPGTATVSVRNFNGKTASMKITVLPAPESVSFGTDAPTLGVGQSHRLSASVNPESVSAITFSGDNPEIAEVAPDGSVTARATGSVTVTATAYNGVSSSQTISVVAAPTRIELSASSVTLCVGEKLDAPVRINLDSEITGGLSFKSSNTRYATVNGSGRVSALRKGSVTITIRTYNGVTAKYTVRIVKAPSKIALSGANMLGVGDSAALKVTANSGAGVGHYSLSSSDPSILEIDPATNRVLAIAPGTATVSVHNFNGKTASMKITVLPAPESVSFSAEAPTLGVGQSHRLSASVNPESVSAITFSGDNPEVAEVAPDGSVTARATGSVTVTATAYNGVSASQTINVLPAPTRIELSASSVTLCEGEKLDAPVRISLDSEITGGLSFKSSNTRYATVNGSGHVSALRKGSVTITIRTYNGVTAKYTVRIVKAPSKIALSGANMLGVGDSAALKVTANSGAGVGHYSLSSSDPSILEIDPATNRVLAIAPGTATVSVRNFNGKTASMKITVLPAPESVSFSAEAPTLGVGQTHRLSASVNPESVSAITFSGDNPEVAEVAPDGSVTARAIGSVTVTATAYNGVSSSQTINVVAAPTQIELAGSTIYIGLGEVLPGALQVRFNEGSAGSVRYSSSSTRYVKVSADGTLTGVRLGNAIITVTAHNGVTAKCRVIVQKAPSRVAIRLPMPAFSVGQTQLAEVSVTGRGHWMLTSSDPTVVAVEDGGLLRALQEGDVTITARTYNGKTASAKLHVCPAPEEVHPAVAEASVGEGMQLPVEFYVNEGSFASFSYAVADPTLAQVDERGCVTGLKRGHTQVLATTHNGLTASMELEILPGPDAILFDDAALSIGLGELRSFGFTIEPKDAVAIYSYSSSNPQIVRVGADGQLAGMGIGTADVTVTAQNGTSATLSVTVVPYCETNTAICLAHRGASGYYPGNSLEAFRHAAELGADMVELDVRKTKDGVIVVIHDGTITYNGKKYNVAALTLKQLQIANPNVCTLDDALRLIASTGMDVMIEFKVSDIEPDVLNLVNACGMDGRARYGSFSLSVINRIKSLQPSAKTIYIISSADALKKVVANPQSFSASIISVSAAILKATDIYKLHLGGKQVVVWTINSRSEIERFISMGIDGITTDYPDYM